MMVNRSAIVVTPKQPFLDWLHKADPTSLELTLLDVAADPSIYLIRECDNDVSKILHEAYTYIFEEQLASWCTDESVWPPDRTFEVFRSWFEYSHHSMILDLSDEPLIRE